MSSKGWENSPHLVCFFEGPGRLHVYVLVAGLGHVDDDLAHALEVLLVDVLWVGGVGGWGGGGGWVVGEVGGRGEEWGEGRSRGCGRGRVREKQVGRGENERRPGTGLATSHCRLLMTRHQTTQQPSHASSHLIIESLSLVCQISSHPPTSRASPSASDAIPSSATPHHITQYHSTSLIPHTTATNRYTFTPHHITSHTVQYTLTHLSCQSQCL